MSLSRFCLTTGRATFKLFHSQRMLNLRVFSLLSIFIEIFYLEKSYPSFINTSFFYFCLFLSVATRGVARTALGRASYAPTTLRCHTFSRGISSCSPFFYHFFPLQPSNWHNCTCCLEAWPWPSPPPRHTILLNQRLWRPLRRAPRNLRTVMLKVPWSFISAALILSEVRLVYLIWGWPSIMAVSHASIYYMTRESPRSKFLRILFWCFRGFRWSNWELERVHSPPTFFARRPYKYAFRFPPCIFPGHLHSIYILARSDLASAYIMSPSPRPEYALQHLRWVKLDFSFSVFDPRGSYST